jgi:heme/copper-type cytochrome/quinol oxidase subunit 2
MDYNELNAINNIRNNNIYKKRIIGLYTVVCILISVILLIYSFANYYYLYYFNKGIVINNHILKVTIKSSDIDKIIDNKKINIKGKSYKYKINMISKNKKLDINNDQYQEIWLDIKNNKLISNEIISFKIRYSKIKLIKYIYLYLIGGS